MKLLLTLIELPIVIVVGLLIGISHLLIAPIDLVIDTLCDIWGR